MSLISCKIVKTGASYEEYHRQDAKRGALDFSMSRSELVEFAECPAKYILGPQGDDSTDALAFGSLMDCLITQPERFGELFAVCPALYISSKGEAKEWRNDRRIEAVAEFLDANEGKTIIKADVKAAADLAVKNVMADETLRELLAASKKQVFIVGFWHDKETGLKIPLRSLLDIVPPIDFPGVEKTICDFKTSRNGNPARWAMESDDKAYDQQAALHFDMYCAATGEDRTTFAHIVQENVPPFHVVDPIPAMTPEFLEWGRQKYQKALRLYAQCLATNAWPSYPLAGLKVGKMQFIGPDDLWEYKKTGGMGRFMDYQPQPQPTEQPEYSQAG